LHTSNTPQLVPECILSVCPPSSREDCHGNCLYYHSFIPLMSLFNSDVEPTKNAALSIFVVLA